MGVGAKKGGCVDGLTVLSVAGAALCVISFIAGLIDAIAGGGGLIALPAFLAVGFPPHYIMGTSQCSTIPATILTTVQFAREGKVHWPSALICLPACIVGALLGAKLNIVTPEHVLRIIMVVLVPVVALVVLGKRESMGEQNRVDELSRRRLVVTNLLIGLVFGAYQGFYGAGSGTFLIMAFALGCKLDLVTASGNMKFVCMASTIVATFTYVLEGLVAWDFVLGIMLFNTVGAFIGARLALTRGTRAIRPMFVVVLALLLVKVVADLLG